MREPPMIAGHLLQWLRARLGGPSGRGTAFPATRPARAPVIVGATGWTVNGVNVFSANLVRGLAPRRPAHILLTEERTQLINDSQAKLPWPTDVPFDYLPVTPWDGWGAHWGTLVRYLERRAPCIYIPNSDWRHSCVASRLPDDVVIVGIVHSDDPLHYDHVARMGRFWNAIVCVSRAIAQRVAERNPSLSDRIVVIPIGVDVPVAPPAPRPSARPLRVVYHGILKQHQKHVFDLPRIAARAVARGVSLELTVIGAGPDEDELRARSEELVRQGVMHFHAPMSHAELLALVGEQDVFLLPSQFEGMPNALLEAMARGCVPLVSRTDSGIPELVVEGRTGCLVAFGDVEGFAAKLATLAADRPALATMAAAAHRAVIDGGFSVEVMVGAYEALFARLTSSANHGGFVRPREPFVPPPPLVEGVSIFPVPLPHDEPDVGRFPSRRDAEEYRWALERVFEPRVPPAEMPAPRRVVAPSSASLKGVRVTVAAPVWTRNGINTMSEDLVRGLQQAGIESRLLLTEENTALVTIDEPRMPRPTDVPVEELTVHGADCWGARWGAMQRYLERSAPGIYLPGFDWRHSCVVPRLSDRVSVVGLVAGQDALHAEHAARLGRHWNATIALDPAGRAAIPHGRERIVEIPIGYDLPRDQVRERVRDTRVEPLRLLAPGICSGTDEARLRGALEDERGARILTVEPNPSRGSLLRLLDTHDVLLVTMRGADDRRLLVEAMARGCVPIDLTRSDCELLIHGETGLRAPGASLSELRELLGRLDADRELLSALASAAAATVRRHVARSVVRMVDQYVCLFEQLQGERSRGDFRRPGGPILPPPSHVGGVGVFPVTLAYTTPDGDRFPSREDFERWRQEIAAPASRGHA